MAALLSSALAFHLGGFRSRSRSAEATMMAGITKGKVHGEGGAFVAGYWVPLRDCDKKFNIKGGSNENTAATPCPRSITRHSAAKEDGTYDVVIIGAGCIGSAVARELSKTTASVLMVESADDVCQGATKGNSGIVHAGYDDTPGSTRAKLCWKGNQMFPALDEDLHFGYQLTGSLVVATSAADEEFLNELYQRGLTNGVKNLRIVRGSELKRIEPNLDPSATAALLSPDAGTLIPYEYNIALAENAADNGVEVRNRRMVKSISKGPDGLFDVNVDHWEPGKYVEEQAKQEGSSLQAMWSKLVDGAESAQDALGNYFGGVGEGGPWQDYPQLKKAEQKVTNPHPHPHPHPHPNPNPNPNPNQGLYLGRNEVGDAGAEALAAALQVRS